MTDDLAGLHRRLGVLCDCKPLYRYGCELAVEVRQPRQATVTLPAPWSLRTLAGR